MKIGAALAGRNPVILIGRGKGPVGEKHEEGESYPLVASMGAGSAGKKGRGGAARAVAMVVVADKLLAAGGGGERDGKH